MKNLAGRLKELKQVAFYMAPDDARVTPVQIPENVELVELITGGEVFFEVDGEEKTFGKGTIFWHQAGEQTIWRTTPESPYRCAVFLFLVSDLDRPVPRVSFWNADTDADIDRFASECISLFHTQELDTDVLSLYIYSTLLRHAMAEGDSTSRRNNPEPLDRALAYIHHHIGEKFSIAVLAKNSRVSQPQLFKLFQTHMGITPHRYILSQQLARARTMLAGTPLPIKEIASECGFESLEVFYRRFRCESGMPPGEYRRKYLPYHFPKNN
jgi:AraC-like DNA-binding protein